jgi:predicted NAD/FAD-dependent oxidoreductase
MQIAIIGAGAAGLACAWALRDAGASVTVFEKSRAACGRAATRRRERPGGLVRYDHGANYVKPPPGSPPHRLLTEHLPTDDLARIDHPVWPFGPMGELHPEQAEDDGAPKLTYRPGIAHLGKLLAAAADTGRFALHKQTRIGGMQHEGGAWSLTDDAGADLGQFDAVLMTAPAPQAAELIERASLDGQRRSALLAALRASDYRSQFALVLGFDQPIERPRPFYALVATGDGNDFPVAWLAFEEDKPGHVPDGHSVLVAQMSPSWTEQHYYDDPAALVEAARVPIGHLVGRAIPVPDWSDTQRWRYALPDTAADHAPLDAAAEIGLFFAGDFLAGKGRVHLALESGLGAADRMAEALGLRS